MHERLKLTKLSDGQWEMKVKGRYTIKLSEAERRALLRRLKETERVREMDNFLRVEFKDPDSFAQISSIISEVNDIEPEDYGV